MGAALEVTRMHTYRHTHVLITTLPFPIVGGGGGDLARHLQISGGKILLGDFFVHCI